MAIETPTEFELNTTKKTEKDAKLSEDLAKKSTLDEKKREKTAEELISENTLKLADQAAAGIGYDSTKSLTTNLESMSRNLLGKSSTPASSANFDPNVVMGQLSLVTNQVNNLMQPLKSAVGSIPGLSPIIGMVGTLTAASKTTEKTPPTADEELPDLTLSMKTSIVNTLTNVMTFMSLLPLMFFKLIFMMLQKILELLLKIFDELMIKVSNIFPLNLIKDALTLIPKLMDFMTDAPGLIKDASENIMRRQLNSANELALQECHVVDAKEQLKINDDKNNPTKEEEKALLERYGDSIKSLFSSCKEQIDPVCKKVAEYDPIKRIFPHDPGPPEPKPTDDMADATSKPSSGAKPTTPSPPKTV